MRRIVAALGALGLVGSLIIACGPPKQAEVADVVGGTGEDMAGDAPPAKTAEADAPPAPETEDMRTKCCAGCKEGLATDKTGADPKTIPCADYTSTLTPWCLEHFRSKPAMAADCK
jgi:hypothetical protein